MITDASGTGDQLEQARASGSNKIDHLWINENTMHRHIPHLFTEIPFNVNDVAFICRFNIVFATDYLAYNL